MIKSSKDLNNYISICKAILGSIPTEIEVEPEEYSYLVRELTFCSREPTFTRSVTFTRDLTYYFNGVVILIKVVPPRGKND